MIARANLGIRALEPVEPDHLQPLIFCIGQDRARRSGALAGDFEHIALGDAEPCHGGLGQSGNALAALFLPRRRDLQLYGFLVDDCWRVGHGADSQVASRAS